MSDPQLITPADVGDVVVEVLRRRHPEHLAAAERRRGVAPETYERLRTVGHRHDPRNRLAADTCPSVLVGCTGTLEEPVRTELEALDMTLALDVEVAVIGLPRDILQRRDVTAWSVAECLLQRLPRSGPVSALRLRDFENVEDEDGQEVLARVRFMFAVDVREALSIRGLPAEHSGWPAGMPGGPPPDGAPYTPPVPLPPATEIVRDIDREPISP